ncbi:NADPH-dependent FMN reductase [Leucobacter soli]|uniref:NADPH-dependent FMN reductase-like domain-containing protein n=1 Tax=Leucobacter soli TaxID=2812850 RepID=A0A916K083_9MICO|nr:NAD(P)H-dependent oxidoreductase [Leucobacter soli]CAG7621116.1 hypothetical protein LEUCIP111803_02411 [Leucobacter soli]
MSDQTSRDQINIVAISCSPFGGGKTRTAIEAVLSGAAAAGARTTLIELGEDPGSPPDYEAAVEAIRAADGIAFGSPMYRATYTQQFKALTEAIPRTPDDAPLAGRAVTTVATAGSDHHMLGMSGMRDILVDFFAAHLVSPGLFVSPAGFDGPALQAPVQKRAETLGLGLVELATAIRSSSGLARATPNA